MYLVVGLGNPGKAYEKTRHNIGFRVLDFIAQQDDIVFTRESHLYLGAQSQWDGKSVFFMKPLTYMNHSGLAVQHWVQQYTLEDFSHLMVVVDDLQLPFGTLRMRRKGSDGGHKGLRSIIKHMGRQDFPRLRIGIGDAVEDAVTFVLSSFHPDEEIQLPKILQAASSAIRTFVCDGIEHAMNRFNGQVLDLS